ncbi:MAG: TraE/TraK family type IV conjugative transfer system protein [Rhodospirillales bacterium]|nr:TraE/TraK family type IV conjugative transfer system protein [Rhodospirillales bacterium]
MRRTEMDSAIRRVRDVRLALAGLLVLSMTANLALTLSFAGRETVTVLVPATAGPAWEVAGGGAGTGLARARYLEDMARTVAVTLLTLTPENAAHVRLAAARMSHASARGAIGAWVEAEAARMAGRDLASAFYPGGIEADPERLTVEISGELVTWIGREEAAREDRRYRLVFRIDAGRIGLLRFEQLESGK